jgi:hypothetical protein
MRVHVVNPQTTVVLCANTLSTRTRRREQAGRHAVNLEPFCRLRSVGGVACCVAECNGHGDGFARGRKDMGSVLRAMLLADAYSVAAYTT